MKWKLDIFLKKLKVFRFWKIPIKQGGIVKNIQYLVSCSVLVHKMAIEMPLNLSLKLNIHYIFFKILLEIIPLCAN